MTSYPNWIEELIAQSEGTTSEPKDEVAKDEKELGVVPDGLKPLYHAMDPLIAEKKVIREEHEALHVTSREHTDKCAEFKRRTKILDGKIDCLKSLFWTSVCEALGCWDMDLAVRKGWKVVERPADPEEQGGCMVIMVPEGSFRM